MLEFNTNSDLVYKNSVYVYAYLHRVFVFKTNITKIFYSYSLNSFHFILQIICIYDMMLCCLGSRIYPIVLPSKEIVVYCLQTVQKNRHLCLTFLPLMQTGHLCLFFFSLSCRPDTYVYLFMLLVQTRYMSTYLLFIKTTPHSTSTKGDT